MLSVPLSSAADNGAYRVRESVFGRTYAQWNADWARFEWAPSASASPLLHPAPCRHQVLGRVFFVPGPGKSTTVTCDVGADQAVFIPTASTIDWVAKKRPLAAVRRS